MERRSHLGALTSEDLLAHASRIRALAYGLLHDEGQVDDVTQQAFLTALERPPRKTSSLGSWLHVVALRLSLQHLRRGRREVSAPIEDLALADPQSGTAERLETMRRLTAALEGLPEPYRCAVMWRYLDDLRPREIAQRFGVPNTQVSTWIHRGLQMLRTRLNTQEGPAWRNGCRALLRPGETMASTSGGAWLLSAAASRLAVGAAAFFLILMAVGHVLHQPLRPDTSTSPPAAALPTELEAPDFDANNGGRTTAVIEAVLGHDRETDLLAPAPCLLRGSVFLRGRPVPGAHVELRRARVELGTVTDETGSFSFDLPRGDADLVPLESYLDVDSPTGAGVKDIGSAQDFVRIDLSLKPKHQVIVTSEATGSPIPNVLVKVFRGNDIRGNPTMIGDLSAILSGMTDLSGVWSYEGGPAEGVLVYADSPGWESAGCWGREGDQPGQNEGVVTHRLQLIPRTGRYLRLVDSGGIPLGGAKVRYQIQSVNHGLYWDQGVTDDAGRMELSSFNSNGRGVIAFLASGRVWISLAGPEPLIGGQEVLAAVADPSIRVRGGESHISEGCWLEARRWPVAWQRDDETVYGWAWPELNDLGWTRIETGLESRLETGWTGADLGVQVRLQPSGQILGFFPIQDGIAEIGGLRGFPVRFRMPWKEEPAGPAWRLDLEEAAFGSWRSCSIPWPSGEDLEVELSPSWFGLTLYDPAGRRRASRNIEVTEPGQVFQLEPSQSRPVHVRAFLGGLPALGGMLRFAQSRDSIVPGSQREWAYGRLDARGIGQLWVPEDVPGSVWTVFVLWPDPGLLDSPEGPIVFGRTLPRPLAPTQDEIELSVGLVPCVLWVPEEAKGKAHTIGVLTEMSPPGEPDPYFTHGSVIEYDEGLRLPSSVGLFQLRPGQDALRVRLTEGRWRVVCDGQLITPSEGVLAVAGSSLEIMLPGEQSE